MVPIDPCDPLVDAALADEIALLGEVVAAATAVAHPLSDDEVDEVLGLSASDTPARPPRPRRSNRRARA